MVRGPGPRKQKSNEQLRLGVERGARKGSQLGWVARAGDGGDRGGSTDGEGASPEDLREEAEVATEITAQIS